MNSEKYDEQRRAIQVAKQLVGDGENKEYTRGICEFLADFLKIPSMPGWSHSEMASKVAEDFLNIDRNKIYPDND